MKMLFHIFVLFYYIIKLTFIIVFQMAGLYNNIVLFALLNNISKLIYFCRLFQHTIKTINPRTKAYLKSTNTVCWMLIKKMWRINTTIYNQMQFQLKFIKKNISFQFINKKPSKLWIAKNQFFYSKWDKYLNEVNWMLNLYNRMDGHGL